MLSVSQLATSPFLPAVKHYEGFYSAPYKCPAGVWTIGYGHTKGVSASSKPITQAEANILLLSDMAEAGMDVMRLAGEVLQDTDNMAAAAHRFEALASWVFNLGATNLSSSTMLKRIKEKQWEEAAKEMLRWDKAKVNGISQTLPGLTKRRKSESHYFLTGEVVIF